MYYRLRTQRNRTLLLPSGSFQSRMWRTTGTEEELWYLSLKTDTQIIGNGQKKKKKSRKSRVSEGDNFIWHSTHHPIPVCPSLCSLRPWTPGQERLCVAQPSRKPQDPSQSAPAHLVPLCTCICVCMYRTNVYVCVHMFMRILGEKKSG